MGKYKRIVEAIIADCKEIVDKNGPSFYNEPSVVGSPFRRSARSASSRAF